MWVFLRCGTGSRATGLDARLVNAQDASFRDTIWARGACLASTFPFSGRWLRAVAVKGVASADVGSQPRGGSGRLGVLLTQQDRQLLLEKDRDGSSMQVAVHEQE